MKQIFVAFVLFLVSLYCISCHSTTSGPANDTTVAKPPPPEAIHNPEFRLQVKKEPAAEYKEKVNDHLNTDWFFSVKLYETSRTMDYRITMRYEELEADDTLKLPDLGTPPKPVIQKGKDAYSCMIGFMDNENRFREYKLVYVKGDQLGIRAVKHYSVTQGYRLITD